MAEPSALPLLNVSPPSSVEMNAQSPVADVETWPKSFHVEKPSRSLLFGNASCWLSFSPFALFVMSTRQSPGCV